MEIPYILLSNREVMTIHSFLEGDLKIIRMLEGMKNRFNPLDCLKFQLLREREISRDYWKWILKFLKINITQMRIIFY